MPDGISSAVPLFGSAPANLTSPRVEQSLLGALLGKVELLAALPAGFDAEHLTVDGHPDIYRAIRAVAEARARGPVMLEVGQAVGADEGMRSYIAELVSAAVGFLPDMVASQAAMVTDLHRRRELAGLCERALGDLAAMQGHVPADAVIASLMSGVDALSGGVGGAKLGVSLDDAVAAAMQAAEEASRRAGPAGLSTAMQPVDDALGGLEDGTLTVIAGRPGMGKSALCHQWALAAARQGVGVVEISLEMSAMQLGRRTLSVAAGVPIWRLKRGQHQASADALVRAQRELRGLPLTIEDGAGLTASMIALKVRAAHRKHGVGLIMVDHLHIVRPDDSDIKHGPTWGIGRISGAMKRLAKDFRCPVLLAAQLNRGVDGREDKRPTLSDLRQSGDIEQDADAVGFVYRPEYYLGNEPEMKAEDSADQHDAKVAKWRTAKANAAGKAELILAKVRDGETQTIPLLWNGETASFSEAPVEHG